MHLIASVTVLYFILLCCTVLHCTVLYCTVLYCTVLYCTVLYCTVLYCTVIYYILLSSTPLLSNLIILIIFLLLPHCFSTFPFLRSDLLLIILKLFTNKSLHSDFSLGSQEFRKFKLIMNTPKGEGKMGIV